MSTSDATVDKALAFTALKSGWHYGRGSEIDLDSIYSALIVNRFLKEIGASATEVFPDESGGVMISGYSGDETIDTLCEPSGLFSLFHEDDDEVICDVDFLSMNDVLDYMKRIKWYQKKSSDLYTPFTTALKRRDSRALASHNHTMEYQLLAPPVQENVAVQNATIFQDSTQKTSQDNLLYSFASNVA